MFYPPARGSHQVHLICMSDAFFYSLMAGNTIRCSYYLISITKSSFSFGTMRRVWFWPDMPVRLTETILTLVWMNLDVTRASLQKRVNVFQWLCSYLSKNRFSPHDPPNKSTLRDPLGSDTVVNKGGWTPDCHRQHYLAIYLSLCWILNKQAMNFGSFVSSPLT